MGQNPKFPEKPAPSSFTVDAEKTGTNTMPGITKLLNRKTLGLSSGSDGKREAASNAPSPSPSFPPKPAPAYAPASPSGSPAVAMPILESVSPTQIATPSPTSSGLSIVLEPVANEATPAHGTAASKPTATEAPSLSLALEPSGPAPAPAATPVASSASPPQAIELNLSIESAATFELETRDGAAAAAPASAAPSPATEIAVPAPTTDAISLSLDASPAPMATSAAEPAPRTLRIQPARSRGTRAVLSPLVRWNLPQLEKSSDPLGKALSQAFRQGAGSALFLAIQAPPPGSSTPVFAASAVVEPGLKEQIWTGLRFDPNVAPEIWNAFLRDGTLTLSPPGTYTLVASPRNLLRAAFGVNPDEALVLVRVGPANACRGVAALIAKRDLTPALSQLTTWFFQPAPAGGGTRTTLSPHRAA